MKIKSVTINKYKSITKPVTINFDENLIVLIGKNGSGKSNILEALQTIFAQNRGYLGESRRKELDCRITLELSQSELEMYRDFNEYRGKVSEITVGLDYDRFCRDYGIPNSKFRKKYPERLNQISALSKKLVNTLTNYRERLSKILKQISNKGLDSLTNLKELIGEIKDKDELLEYDIAVAKDLLAINNEPMSAQAVGYRLEYYERKYETYSFNCKLRRQLPDYRAMSQYVTFDKNGLQAEISKINDTLKKIDWSTLNSKLKELERLVNSYLNLTKSERNEYNRKYQLREEFWRNIQSVIDNKSYFIPNDEVIFNNDDHYYKENGAVDSRYTQLLVESFIRLNYSATEADEKISNYRQRKGVDIDYAKFEELLNRDIPKFEQYMYERIKVDTKDSKIRLFIVENNGAEVSFNSTSLGRRWFFTYYFQKNRLGNGDMLILDEPASALHPTAQLEILKDIEKVAQNNTVIMCTHSPYMISDKVKKINLVRMEGDTTVVQDIHLNYLSDYVQDAGMLASRDMLFSVEKTHILCEGAKDVACFSAFMKRFGVDRSKYQIFQIHGCPKITSFVEFYFNNQLPSPIVFLDADRKEEILKKKISYQGGKAKKTISELISEGVLNLVFVGENTPNHCIEDLFSEHDKEIFTEKQNRKNKVKKVRNCVDELLETVGCSAETDANFRALFTSAGLLDK